MPTLDQFLAGEPLEFVSLAGHARLATFITNDTAPHMVFTYPGGKVICRPLMSRSEAGRFYREAMAAMERVAA